MASVLTALLVRSVNGMLLAAWRQEEEEEEEVAPSGDCKPHCR